MPRPSLASFLLGLAVLSIGACRTEAPSADAPRPMPPPASAAVEPAPADCSVEVEGPASAAVGERATAKVVLRPHGRFEVNQDAPLTVEVASPTLDLDKERYGIDDASVLAPDEVALEIPFSASTPGTHVLEVHAHFGLCSGESCALCRQAAELATVVN